MDNPTATADDTTIDYELPPLPNIPELGRFVTALVNYKESNEQNEDDTYHILQEAADNLKKALTNTPREACGDTLEDMPAEPTTPAPEENS